MVLVQTTLAIQLKWNISDSVTLDVRQNWMDIDRSFGGANGAGLVVLNEDGEGSRTTEIVPGYRFIDRAQTDAMAQDFYNPASSCAQLHQPSYGCGAGSAIKPSWR